MKRFEHLRMLADEAGYHLREKISQEGLLRAGEIVEISISVAVKLVQAPVSCNISDHDEKLFINDKKLNMSLAEIELSVRATNCLESDGITTLGQLVGKSAQDLFEIRNLGESLLREIRTKVANYGLKLKGD